MSYLVGRGRPPQETQFVKGRSGNPRGRPKTNRKDRPFEAVFSQLIPLQIGGEERVLRADEAFILSVAQFGVKGRPATKRAALSILKLWKLIETEQVGKPRKIIFCVYADPGDVKDSLHKLQAAKTLFRCQPTAHVVLEPWVVQAGLDRLGERQLSKDEQKVVIASTRKAHTVDWPDWWSILPGSTGDGGLEKAIS